MCLVAIVAIVIVAVVMSVVFVALSALFHPFSILGFFLILFIVRALVRSSENS